MKFSEMTYTRPDIDALLADCKALAAKAAAAPDGDALVAVYYEQSRAFADYTTASQLANIHYTCDTRDAYWKAEQDFFDANGPAVSNASVEISRAFLANPHVDALTEAFGSTCVAGMKNAVLGMDERTVALQQEYNALVSTYQQIYGGALVEFDGRQLTIPQLGPYKESTDAATRRAAYEAEAGYFDAHRAELDELYTKIVKNLNQQAQVMGYHDYSELSYVRMNRIGYGPEDIKRFREQVAHDVVPELQKVIALKNKRTGIQHPTFADLPVAFKDGNPKPIEGYDARMAAARTMYHELSPETAEFIDFMQDNEMFDVLSRPGKMSGGYEEMLPDYKTPFIFANWNGTAGDVDVLTHEAGHALEGYLAARSPKNIPEDIQCPGMESAEIHSMSMEFLTAPWHRLFFKEDTDKYELLHAEDSKTLSLISLYLISPCVIISAFQVQYTPDVLHGLLLALAAAVLLHVGIIVVVNLLGHALHLDAVEKASMIYSNAGNLIIPIVTAVLGKEWVIYSSAFLSVQLFLLWSHAKSMLCGEKSFELKKVLTNINMIAILAGAALFLLHIQLPAVIEDSLDMVGSAIGPISMIILGMLMAGMNFKKILGYRRLWLVTALRLVGIPLAAVALLKLSGLAHLVPGGQTILLVSLLATCTPSASTITQMAQIYGKDADYASAINVVTTLLCIFTMPLMVALYQL